MDFLAQQFIASAKRIRDEIAKIITSLSSLGGDLKEIKVAAESIDKATKATQDAKPAPIEVRALLNLPGPIETKRDSHDDRQQRRDRWRLFIEALTLFAILGYGYMTIRMWREMISARHQTQRAIDAANRAATAAENTLTETHKNFISDERPYIGLIKLGIPVVETGNKARWDFSYANFGKTPAIGLLVKSEVVITDPVPEYKGDPTSQAEKRVFARIHPKGREHSGVLMPQLTSGIHPDIGPKEYGTLIGSSRAFSHEPMTPHQTTLAHTSEILGVVTVLIHFEYFDSAGNEYRGEACQSWSFVYGIMSPCDIHQRV
jgi:hypothetical protein